MTREIQILIRDDFDGSPEATTITFAFRGTEYEIDLSDRHIQKFEEVLAPYLARGRKPEVSANPKRYRGGKHSRTEELRKVRTWARKNGYPIDGRGIIPKDIHEAYNREHPNAPIALPGEQNSRQN